MFQDGRPIVLFGAGNAGVYALRHLKSQGIVPDCFADNNPSKQGLTLGGLPVFSPQWARTHFPDARWVACGISRPAALEIRKEIREMGVESIPLWKCIPVPHGQPPSSVRFDLRGLLCNDILSVDYCGDQIEFRHKLNYDRQMDPLPISEMYFPSFIRHLDKEVFVDCGAADGDTVKQFMGQWDKWAGIIAFEPDLENYRKLVGVCDTEANENITPLRMAVSDFDGDTGFTSNGDYSSHIGAGDTIVRSIKLDTFFCDPLPTYIKMDIEGAELEALWGARKMIQKNMPVLAICAYHTSDHFWQIPLLIHAIQPDYRLLFRRYAEGAFELVWYAVPPERIIQ